MEKAALTDVDSSIFDGVERRALSDALGASDVAVNHYRVPPGDGLPSGLHAHADQEEIFVVLDGVATFETYVDGDGGEVVVEEGEAIRFAPGEFQSGRNGGEETLVSLAFGAPNDSEDVRIPIACPECESDEVRLAVDGESVTFVCPVCGAEHIPAACPECTGEVHAALGDDAEPLVRCRDCGREYSDPPLHSPN